MNRREFLGRIGLTAGGLMVLQSGCVVRPETSSPSALAGNPGNLAAGPTAEEFASPPFDCGPWVYWFWLDVNVTREGITADLEAMKAVGIAGVLIMDVDQGTPASFVGSKFGDAQWYELFKFACEEANRLGIEVNMTNDAGWCGSGGPWITPELSMQVVVWSTTSVSGGQRVDLQLSQPEARMDYYRDIAVLAFPIPAAEKVGRGYRIGDLHGLTEGYLNPQKGAQDNISTRLDWDTLSANQVVPKSSVLDVTKKMNRHGVLRCELPAGDWTILRMGHTTTGVKNHPAPDGGLGLETDKLSRRVTLFQFDALMGRIIEKIGPLAGKSLVATHIDSWETGVQNWTPTMRPDFKRLRGYDLLPYLPVLTGQVVESLEVSQRFLWDFRQTIGELLVENYAAAMREVAGKHGLRLSIEAYFGEPANDVRYGGQAVEPMSECWSWPRYGARASVTEMTGAAHVYGHNIIGQETFTANSEEKWLGHPAVVKDIGDWTFAEGINRFVFHRYAMQPWTNPHYGPGMSMGPWGLHYERTQTWWNMSKPWHDYLARCQYMLRKGRFVADVCYMQAEGSPANFTPPGQGSASRRPGYNYDGCPAELVLKSMEFQDGFLTLPGGMKYRVLVLPDSPTMTPELLQKIKALVDAGALVIGPKPGKSPSLGSYPDCDAEVQRLAAELWDSGKIISGTTAAEALAKNHIRPDFECDQSMVRWIHRRTEDTDIYFVANGAADGKYPYSGWPMVANCSFRVTGVKPEIWDPETGRVTPIVLLKEYDGMTRIPLVLPAKASVFVVFRRGQSVQPEQVMRSVSRDGKTVLLAGTFQNRPDVEILGATYGKPGEPKHTRDATADVRKLAGNGNNFSVADVAATGGDPDLNVVKTLDIHCRIDGQEQHLVFHDGEIVDFNVPGEMPPATVEAAPDGGAQLCVTEAGSYDCVFASGKTVTISVRAIPEPVQVDGPWTVKFPDGWGAPDQIQLDKLIPLNEHSDSGVKYFSGVAMYQCQFNVLPERFAAERRISLDLGNVAVMADVTLNGEHLGILWKAPFQIDVTSRLREGQNTLEIAVANLWVNRLIGDQQLPADSDRNKNGTLKSWPQWLLDGKPSPTGRLAFTTWELWRKDDPLVESGLIGPVRLVTTVCKPV
ncbi:MAG TPA: glycosyl hydrolase [Candidatus Sulfotelmatobacter sp.]|nr:glycosyl hydrolase [Candidatus Sulfotelmatobacter sp.]